MAPVRVAALDVGSNTVHLLVAEPAERGVREVLRLVVMPRIGAAVNATGAIGEAKIAEVGAELRRMAAAARESGATTLLLCATEAVRKASDRDRALHAFSDAAGVECVLLPGEVEARLAFRGAVAMAAAAGPALVCDIGGGSTELALGEGSRIDALVSLAIGSGLVTDRWLADDPPSPAQRAACASGVRSVLRAAPAAGAAQPRVIATGGTAASLPRLLDRDVESELDAADLDQCRALLGSRPSAEIAVAYSLDPARARVLAGGVEIVDATREAYGADRVRATIHGLRTGMILAYAEKGARWVEG